MILSTASKAHLHLKCPGWARVPAPELEDKAGPRALFGTYIHSVAENELNRQCGVFTGNAISEKMTAEQEAAFNPPYTPEIGGNMSSEEWGTSVYRLINELRGLFPDIFNWYSEAIHAVGLLSLKSHFKKRDNQGDGPRDYKSLQSFFLPGEEIIAGTIDFIGSCNVHSTGKTVVVGDWKTGEEPVSPIGNPQLILAAYNYGRYYGLNHDDVLYLVIGNIRTGELLMHRCLFSEVTDKANQIISNARKNDLITGAHCVNCPKMEKCPAVAKLHVKHPDDPKDWTADQLAIAAMQCRELGKTYRELLIQKHETDSNFNTKYLKKGSQGWRLSVYESQAGK
jgi:hypothetical protein